MASAPAQLLNAAGAVFRIAGATVKGDALQATSEMIAERRAVCLDCAHCVKVPKGETVYHRCAQCGCWLDGKFFAKLKLATESCPLGKWRSA